MEGISFARSAVDRSDFIDQHGNRTGVELEKLDFESDYGVTRIVGYEGEKGKGVGFEITVGMDDLVELVRIRCKGNLENIKRIQSILLNLEADVLSRNTAE